ncbi:MAG: SGNH/GDSL hydrolase family protein [Lachnospiraceae bacterium]|nr:SGNH/GDSL hydrolase family protein [Lachnospiraceae bacterium]
MKRWKKVCTAVISIVVVMALFFGLQRLVVPKYDGTEDMPLEGNFTAEYYKESTKHDVLMVGDCEVYENFDPMYLWKNYGITSYIRGNAQQLVWQSYYMLEDALKYETPKVVIYNVQSLTHGSSQREEYNRMTLDGMKWSQTKVDAIRASMCKGEKMLDYIFPILRYHARVSELKKGDLTYYFKNREITHNGYYMRIDVLPLSESDVADGTWLFGTAREKEDAGEENEIDDPWAELDEEGSSGEDADGAEDEIDDPWGAIDAGEDGISEPGTELAESKHKDRTFSRYAMKYLDHLRTLCKEKGIKLILIKAPSLSPQWYEEENEQVVDYAEKYELPYINFYELLEETGIDFETDTYDGGLHMNLSGADKLSEYLGKILRKEYGLEDHREDPELSKVYEKKLRFYEEMKAAQQKELDKYGEIKTY